MKVKSIVGSEFRIIRDLLKHTSYAELATKLGYKSPATLSYWMEKKKIPRLALGRVRSYLGKIA